MAHCSKLIFLLSCSCVTGPCTASALLHAESACSSLIFCRERQGARVTHGAWRELWKEVASYLIKQAADRRQHQRVERLQVKKSHSVGNGATSHHTSLRLSAGKNKREKHQHNQKSSTGLPHLEILLKLRQKQLTITFVLHTQLVTISKQRTRRCIYRIWRVRPKVTLAACSMCFDVSEQYSCEIRVSDERAREGQRRQGVLGVERYESCVLGRTFVFCESASTLCSCCCFAEKASAAESASFIMGLRLSIK